MSSAPSCKLRATSAYTSSIAFLLARQRLGAAVRDGPEIKKQQIALQLDFFATANLHLLRERLYLQDVEESG